MAMSLFGKTGLMVWFFILLTSPASAQLWYKGNLHTHSLWSDGDDYPEMIMKWYKDHTYDFVALSDHNVLADGEKWIRIKEDREAEAHFKEYLYQFGEDWVTYEKKDSITSVQLKTLEEYRELFEEQGRFLILRSEEITDSYKKKPIHINATNVQELIQPQGGESVAEVMQNNIDAVMAQRKRTGKKIIPHLNHPNFGWAVTAEDIKRLTGERFFEVYNGHPLVHNYGDSLHSGMEEIWDEVLTHYLLNGKGLMYGIAVDDSHNYHSFSPSHSNPGRGWIMVRADKLTPEAILGAIESGAFYSSTGVMLEEVECSDGKFRIDIREEKGISYNTQFVGTMRDRTNQPGRLLKKVSGDQAEYQFNGDELYVRAKIISTKPKSNPYKKGETEVAWTQPVVSRP